jgi:hypothetical protein
MNANWGWRVRRWLREWDTFLLIMAAGVLTGLITFMAFDPSPAGCQAAITHMYVPVRSFTWVCQHP